jgi:hypothetical protein
MMYTIRWWSAYLLMSLLRVLPAFVVVILLAATLVIGSAG